MHGRVEDLGGVDAQRQAEAVADIALALGGKRQVDGDDQGLDPRRRAARDEVASNVGALGG